LVQGSRGTSSLVHGNYATYFISNNVMKHPKNRGKISNGKELQLPGGRAPAGGSGGGAAQGPSLPLLELSSLLAADVLAALPLAHLLRLCGCRALRDACCQRWVLSRLPKVTFQGLMEAWVRGGQVRRSVCEDFMCRRVQGRVVLKRKYVRDAAYSSEFLKVLKKIPGRIHLVNYGDLHDLRDMLTLSGVFDQFENIFYITNVKDVSLDPVIIDAFFPHAIVSYALQGDGAMWFTYRPDFLNNRHVVYLYGLLSKISPDRLGELDRIKTDVDNNASREEDTDQWWRSVSYYD